jgi:hypothetical protein
MPWWTPWVAAYAAIVSTVSLGWTIWRATRDQRESLRTELDANGTPHGVEIIVRVINESPSRSVEVSRIQFRGLTTAGLVSPIGDDAFRPPLPKRLEPNESCRFYIRKDRLVPAGASFSNCQGVHVTDSKNKTYFMPRGAVYEGIRALARAEEVVKASHAGPTPPVIAAVKQTDESSRT